MVNLTEKQFKKKKDQKSIFPMFIKINGDELTPVNIFYKLKGKYKFLLESASLANEEGRYSFMGSNPYMMLSSVGENITVTKDGETKEEKGKILGYAEGHLLKAYEKLDLELPFIGGAIGYIGYDVIRQYENLPDNNTVLNKSSEMKTMINEDNSNHKLEKHSNHELIKASQNKQVISNYEKENFCELVNKAKEYITSGDVFQVVLSQRLKIKNNENPLRNIWI